MKKILISLTLATVLLISGAAFASDKFPNGAVTKSFQQEFSNIKEVKWQSLSVDGIYIADFTYNNAALRAYFSEEGEFLGTAREISKFQLPILVIKALNQKFPTARIVSVVEHSKADGLDYYLTLVTPKGSMIIEANGNGEVSVQKK